MKKAGTVLAAALFLATGCAGVEPPELESLTGTLDGTVNALGNYRALRDRYGEEWEFNRTDTTSTPALGIALSGGGSRSAFFNMGLLRGLHEAGVLERADVLSTVSGGGYVGSWYYLQHYYAPLYDLRDLQPVRDADLFSPGGKYQNYLTTHGELVGTTTTRPVRTIEYVFYAASTVASWPVNLLANGAWGLHYNCAPMRRLYQNGLEREYHAVPRGDAAGPYNGAWFGAGVEEEVGFPQFRDFLESSGLPFPVINTTAHIRDAGVPKNELKSRIVEFTPLAYGSDYYGYRRDHPVTVNKAYAISGGAFDSKRANDDFLGMLWSAGNADLGYYIDNPNVGDGRRRLQRILPFPLYHLTGMHRNDINGTDIYLADGGHAENLGAYSLIRRLTKKIIISDVGEDPDYLFRSYRDLQEAVRRELKAVLAVPAIDERLRTIEDCERRAAADADRERCRKTPHTRAVMRGTISSFPFAERGRAGADRDVTIQVLYIKPVIDPEKIAKRDYPVGIANYYLLHREDKDAFPQQSVYDQTYDPYQVSAYRELGYETIAENRAELDGFLAGKE